ncbi:MAG: Na+ dependent nucleoside transporter N-terminal domain-containing protein, partial [Myxococcota bacterium]
MAVEAVAATLEQAALQAQVGQHQLAVEAWCLVLAADASQRLSTLQALRRSFARSGRTRGVSPLLADLVEALVADANAIPGAINKQTLGLAGTRLDELIAVDPSYDRIPALNTLLGRNVQGNQGTESTSWTARARSIFGIFVLLGAAFALSNNRKRVNLRIVFWGLGLQVFFALIILLTPPGKLLFDTARTVINKVLSFTDDGAGFVFGNIYNGLGPIGRQGPLSLVDGTTGDIVGVGLIFVIHVLPTIIFFGALMSVLFHLGAIQVVVKGIAWGMQRTMGTSGSESLSAAGNIFVGQTEAPLVVKPYLPKMTRSELMAIMCGGFATVAGGVLAAYTRFGLDPGHLLAASVMSAPA